eukprot:SM000057S18399  [mRNA]  locus=s57:391311:392579:+ [translate_table: standard]
MAPRDGHTPQSATPAAKGKRCRSRGGKDAGVRAPKKMRSPILKMEVRVPEPLGRDQVPDDGWNWRKYGKKPIKNSPYPRNYYRCTLRDASQRCSAKKIVEVSKADCAVFLVTYDGYHTHAAPPKPLTLSLVHQPGGPPLDIGPGGQAALALMEEERAGVASGGVGSSGMGAAVHLRSMVASASAGGTPAGDAMNEALRRMGVLESSSGAAAKVGPSGRQQPDSGEALDDGSPRACSSDFEELFLSSDGEDSGESLLYAVPVPAVVERVEPSVSISSQGHPPTIAMTGPDMAMSGIASQQGHPWAVKLHEMRQYLPSWHQFSPRALGAPDWLLQQLPVTESLSIENLEQILDISVPELTCNASGQVPHLKSSSSPV